MSKDVGDSIKASNADWNFSGDVHKTFDSHVSKSVPLYKQGHKVISQLSDYFIKDGSVIYDVGSSTGELFSSMLGRTNKTDVRFIGIEPINEMVNTANEKHNENENVFFINDDIVNVELEPADMIISYYTLQFIPPKYRQVIVDKIYQTLNWGGAFLMFEKVRAPDARFQDIMNELYVDYKLEQGFDSKEIFTKTRSLKGVLEPFSTAGNIDLMKRAGFVDYMSIMKYVNFEGFLAIK
jgi:tRNA (cmo5U34)-methyltransferase